MKTIWLTGLLCTAVCAGCGRDAGPKAPVTGRRGSPVADHAPAALAATNSLAVAPAPAPAPLPSAASAPAPAPAAPVAPAGFDADLAAAEALRDRGDFGAAIEKLAAMRAQYPEQTGRIDALSAVTRTLKRSAPEAEYALRQLTSADPAVSSVAAEKLADGSDLGRILLRKAVRELDDATAVEAAALLAGMADAPSLGPVMDRFLAKPAGPARSHLLKAMTDLAAVAPPSMLAPLFPAVAADRTLGQYEVAGVLAAAAARIEAAGRGDSFDAAIGRKGAFGELRTYIQSACMSTNQPVRAWGATAAEALGLLMPGIHGYYYEGENFEKLAFERVDEQIQFGEGQLVYPNGRKEQISVRWRGRLNIAAAGTYGFRANSDDGNRMWIDGKMLFEGWGNPANLQAAVQLAQGLHDVVIEFHQGVGGVFISVNWTPPGGQEQPLTKAVLMAPP